MDYMKFNFVLNAVQECFAAFLRQKRPPPLSKAQKKERPLQLRDHHYFGQRRWLLLESFLTKKNCREIIPFARSVATGRLRFGAYLGSMRFARLPLQRR